MSTKWSGLKFPACLLLIGLFTAAVALPAAHARAIPGAQEPPATAAPNQIDATPEYRVPQPVYFVPPQAGMWATDQEIAAYEVEVVSSQKALSDFVASHPKTALILLHPDAIDLVDSTWLGEQYDRGRIIAGIDITVDVLSQKAGATLPPSGWIDTVPADRHVFSYIQHLVTVSGHDRMVLSDFAFGDDWFSFWMDQVGWYYHKNITDSGLDALVGTPPAPDVPDWEALHLEMEASFGGETQPSASTEEGGGGPGCSNPSANQWTDPYSETITGASFDSPHQCGNFMCYDGHNSTAYSTTPYFFSQVNETWNACDYWHPISSYAHERNYLQSYQSSGISLGTTQCQTSNYIMDGVI